MANGQWSRELGEDLRRLQQGYQYRAPEGKAISFALYRLPDRQGAGRLTRGWCAPEKGTASGRALVVCLVIVAIPMVVLLIGPIVQ